MASKTYISLVSTLTLLLVSTSGTGSNTTPQTYIIEMSKSDMPPSFTNHQDWYSSTLKSNSMIYTYETAFHGFAAKLSIQEAAQLRNTHGVLSVLPDTPYHLHTTRSPEFLGISPEVRISAFSAAFANHDVVVGVLDTGIWPESPSFNDSRMPPVPPKWKGACETGRGFSKANCNKKIVGARIFYKGFEASSGAIDATKEYKSPRDQDGHGTHTAATAAGVPVPDADLFGYAHGTARGMAPNARIAVYKVCWTGGCFSSDILAAVDSAVSDGVDVLSISLGGGVASYYRDSLSIAAFGAMEKGVFVACSAGNAGPDPVSLTNVSPWITTVGASTMDRDFPASARLGNGDVVPGVSLYRGRIYLDRRKQYPLVYFGANASNPDPRSLCLEGTLDPKAVAGKIVICDRGISPRVQKGEVVKEAGGVGMILSNTEANGEELVADSHLIPAVAVGETGGKAIKLYALTNTKPTGTLTFEGTKLGIRPSPVVAAFSSRGPNFLSMEILKPDIVAPGVNILAAWSGVASPSSLAADRRRVGFNILSGTSMSCPHVGGIAALIKAAHPEWSPAAMKSALMTTAYVHDNMFRPLKDAATGGQSTPYDHGAGHIHPVKALDPGLVYDISAQGYFEFLCTQRLTPLQLKVFGKNLNRTCRHALATPGDLNYPAISVVFPEKEGKVVVVHRTVTNVGLPTSSYHIIVSPFKGVDVVVEPNVLRFTRETQKLTYKVTFTNKLTQTVPVFGALTWKDGGVHSVRSTVAITWLLPM